MKNAAEEDRGMPHAVAIACPLHGHLAPFTHLCELLAQQGVYVTMVCTARFRPFQGRHAAPPPNIRVSLIADDGLPPNYRVSASDLAMYLRHVERLQGPFQEVVAELRAQGPPITCILSDSHLGWVQDVADAFGLPRFCFLTSSVTEFSVLFHQPLLLAQGILPFKAKDGGSNSEVITCVPGLPPTKSTDFPSFLQVDDPSDFEFQYFMRQIARVAEAKRLLVASFQDLEHGAINVLSEKLNLKPIGPLALQGSQEDPEIDACEQWLDKQEPCSVIYVAFGTLATLGADEVQAIANGLLLSNHPFLWALREDTVEGVEDPLPPGFRNTSKGVVVSWTKQRRILKHPSIGAFLTHCGWGSTLEAICNGVPLLCWPLYGDQLLNCNLLVEKWQAGIKITTTRANHGHLSPSCVALSIATIMNSSTYHQNMRSLQALAHRACSPSGISKRNFDQFVSDLHALCAEVPSQRI